MRETGRRTVDQTAIRFNQACIVTLNLLAFLLNWPGLVLAVGLVLLVGTLWPPLALFQALYRRVLGPLGWLKPRPEPDDPEPHLFAQGVGATFLLAASAALFSGATTLGWVLAWVVIVLASINLFFGFCLGCFVHAQLARLGLRVRLPTWR